MVNLPEEMEASKVKNVPTSDFGTVLKPFKGKVVPVLS
jgi:hypothetical protein